MYSEGKFTKDQLEDLYQNIVCVECEKCGKSRILPPGVFPPEDDEQWECRMNFDKSHNSCDIAEDERVRYSQKPNAGSDDDPILQHLISVENKATMKGPLVKDCLPIDINAECAIDCEEAIRKFSGEAAAFDDDSDLDSKLPAEEEANQVKKERLGHEVVEIKNEDTETHLPAKRKAENDDEDHDEIVEVIVKKKTVEVVDLIDD
jgi:hypothetical protein